MKTVNLVSGGIDSSIMAKEFKGINVYIDFGQKYAMEEKEALKKQNIEFDLVKIDSQFDSEQIYINDRNLVMACLIAMIYSPDRIQMAGLKDDNCIDKTEAEFQVMSEIVSRYANKPIEIVSPYWHLTKGELVEQFDDKEKLIHTFSCYEPNNHQPCGDCPACLRRVVALETNGVHTGIQLSDRILKEYLNKIHQYDKDRISRFIIYLKNRYNVIAIDIDGIICEESHKRYIDRKPIVENIKKINSLDDLKILYTARLECDRAITEKWLRMNDVKYDLLVMNKLPYDYLIDDRSKTNFYK